uniref:Putative LAGLIDADG homing endonuclease n=1 Tax=Staurocarteria cerasiformis TaxID=69401 RepID=A0A0S2LQE8_STACE|nr:putative LAGLIDADG homing endonuclease [Carteria cerasiformis]YP_009185167.1 putative LAGLIDADG homing endonuclease [Carteria cerasiformis]ALO63475.1 putative LAGLIDADG homing endonuclease [Carteria cerasiformis]ALO63479.1 putative LAGLIDADG homing endonuclease [Carteria cerasiformis]
MTLSPDWIVGFVDGEGCFSFSLVKNDTLRFKYQIQGEFTVVQHKRDIALLYKLKSYFKCGSVTQNHGERYHFRVKNLNHFLTIIIPFFEKHQLQTNKRFQLPVFKNICLGLEAKQHFTEEGFNELKKLVKELADLKK